LAPFCQAVLEEKFFLNSSQSETRIALGCHICWWNGFNGTKWRNFIEDLTYPVRCLLPSLVPFGQVVSEEKIKI
jgi:hypothetical protein